MNFRDIQISLSFFSLSIIVWFYDFRDSILLKSSYHMWTCSLSEVKCLLYLSVMMEFSFRFSFGTICVLVCSLPTGISCNSGLFFNLCSRVYLSKARD